MHGKECHTAALTYSSLLEQQFCICGAVVTLYNNVHLHNLRVC